MEESIISELEKVTINLGAVDLGQIDLLVDEGFYSNRTDFIRQSIRQQLIVHSAEIKQTSTYKYSVLGVSKYSLDDLEVLQKGNKTLELKVIGTLIIAENVPLALVQETFKSVKVFGIIKARPDIKNYLQTLRDLS
ncbi:hypothetical protein [Paenibacillus glacialis]|uniref:CopG family transcriptional regulator n=1 Tax=Paenibacillus glacialis TaxID=494026 RepID=A0A168P0Q1_9BACL|nr:hypothetical protein [Paenibacillus glacialis]OAB46273.1 hypothetical protein PGLA_02520 [Paenibacillus glacialis]